MDEADRLLDMDFGPIIDKILKVIPRERNTYLFSATMTTKVAKLQRASLNKPVRVEVSSKSAIFHPHCISNHALRKEQLLKTRLDTPRYPLYYNITCSFL